MTHLRQSCLARQQVSMFIPFGKLHAVTYWLNKCNLETVVFYEWLVTGDRNY